MPSHPASIRQHDSITVFGHVGSACTRRVLVMLAEKSLEADLSVVDLSKGEQKGADHLMRQPFGVIPAITIDGFTMYESLAIVRYLEHRYPTPSLTPKSQQDVARMEQFLSVEYSYLAGAVGVVMVQKILNPMFGRPVDEPQVTSARDRLTQVFDVLETALARQPYLAGDEFSLADLNFLPGLATLQKASENRVIEERPSCSAWVQRITSRPSWKSVMARSPW